MKTNTHYITIYKMQLNQFLRKIYGFKHLYQKRRKVTNKNLTLHLKKLENETMKSKAK